MTPAAWFISQLCAYDDSSRHPLSIVAWYIFLLFVSSRVVQCWVDDIVYDVCVLNDFFDRVWWELGAILHAETSSYCFTVVFCL